MALTSQSSELIPSNGWRPGQSSGHIVGPVFCLQPYLIDAVTGSSRCGLGCVQIATPESHVVPPFHRGESVRRPSFLHKPPRSQTSPNFRLPVPLISSRPFARLAFGARSTPHHQNHRHHRRAFGCSLSSFSSWASCGAQRPRSRGQMLCHTLRVCMCAWAVRVRLDFVKDGHGNDLPLGCLCGARQRCYRAWFTPL